jgi:antirestriction protein ArdC
MSRREGYYATLLHELVHWTGAKGRLDRDLGNRFASAAYAAEELIAEIGAAFLCAELKITAEPRPDHAQYISSWLKLLKEDNRAIFTAAARASKAVAFLHGGAL